VVRSSCGFGCFDLFAAANQRKKRRITLLWAIRFAGFIVIAGLLLFHFRVRRAGGMTNSTTSNTTQVAQNVTPPGMSTITVTASSGSLAPQTIQLTLSVH
jgi:hypothetical protein